MFNHSSADQNVVWTRNLAQQTVTYTAARRIDAGEELCISYGGNLWFRDADEPTEDVVTEGEMLGGINLGLDDEVEDASGRG
jgi:SET domain-containing protein